MKITAYTGGFAQTNAYLVETPEGTFLIDAPEGVAAWLAGKNVQPEHVLLTHQHYDHVLDAAALQDAGAKLHAFSDYSQDLTLETLMRASGVPISVAPYSVDFKLDPADSPWSYAGVEISLTHLPGHSPDSVILHVPAEKIVFSGDTLFTGSIGRTDLPGGSQRILLDGIAKHLMVLPSETRVFPGHGPSSTIGAESASNPFLQ
ncbi:MBL fold metallo-hydrolase [Luteolibacter pohnpeiensis]|uniref:MBL fold metallo-hydrolase n=1 Tax=Luteolibacter pohnpeiensis TaxID=454153 RepID=A0A934VXS9_9BACT|nr:MBL fold metallo-hydrolase [Luteolibacter pohnpeiensis]MBK1883804.1 MBL fold metallo-hydrolase [Luteolibacter pohnpeiensis]